MRRRSRKTNANSPDAVSTGARDSSGTASGAGPAAGQSSASPRNETAPPGSGIGHWLKSIWVDGMGRAAMRAIQALALVAIAAVVVNALITLKLVVIPVLLALLLASAFWPMAKLLRRIHVPAVLASMLTMLTATAVLLAIIGAVVWAVSNQWSKLISSASQGLSRIEKFVAQGPLPITQQQLTQAREQLVDTVVSSLSASTVVTGLSTVAALLTGLLLTVVVLFFFLDDGPEIWSFFMRPLKGHWLARGRRIGPNSVATLGGYVRGTALVALVDATFIGLGLFFLGVPLALPLAVIVFLGAFVPIVGATVAGSLAVLVALVTGGVTTALIAAIIVVGVQQLEGNVLLPLIMGQSVKLHPLVILLVLAAGALLAGIIGAILAVPVAAVTWTIIKQWNVSEGSSNYD